MRTLIGLLLLSVVTMHQGCAKETIALGRGSDQDLAHCSKLSSKKKYEEAIECLEIFRSRYAGTSAADDAELQIGDSFFRQKDYLLAAESYEGFLRNHPLHQRADYAFYRLGHSFFMATPKAIDRDQEHLAEAVQAFRTQLRVFPKSSYRSACEEKLQEALTKIGRREYYIGNFYFRTGEYQAAIQRLETVVHEYMQVPKYAKAYHQLTMAFAKLKRFDDAQHIYAAMQAALPNHEWTQRTAKKMRKLTKQPTVEE